MGNPPEHCGFPGTSPSPRTLPGSNMNAAYGDGMPGERYSKGTDQGDGMFMGRCQEADMSPAAI